MGIVDVCDKSVCAGLVCQADSCGLEDCDEDLDGDVFGRRDLDVDIVIVVVIVSGESSMLVVLLAVVIAGEDERLHGPGLDREGGPKLDLLLQLPGSFPLGDGAGLLLPGLPFSPPGSLPRGGAT